MGKDKGKSKSSGEKRGRSSEKAALKRELEAISIALFDAVEVGAGLPEMARIANRALGASTAILDSSGSVLAVAGASSADERELLGGKSASSVELLVAQKKVGELRFLPRKVKPDEYLVRMLATVMALEVERLSAPSSQRADAVALFLKDVASGKVSGKEELRARADDLGIDFSQGSKVVAVSVRSHAPAEAGWRDEVVEAVKLGARSVEPSSHVCIHEDLIFVLVSGQDAETGRRAADRIHTEAESARKGTTVVLGLSRIFREAADLPKALDEARLAMNVAISEGTGKLAFADAGAYKLLLSSLSEDSRELKQFFSETVKPLIEYDEQYRTGLVSTLETYLKLDGKVEATARELFAHRHTVRYRLERIKELTDLDVASTEGREKLSLGLKSMRVLGITPPSMGEGEK